VPPPQKEFSEKVTVKCDQKRGHGSALTYVRSGHHLLERHDGMREVMCSYPRADSDWGCLTGENQCMLGGPSRGARGQCTQHTHGPHVFVQGSQVHGCDPLRAQRQEMSGPAQPQGRGGCCAAQERRARISDERWCAAAALRLRTSGLAHRSRGIRGAPEGRQRVCVDSSRHAGAAEPVCRGARRAVAGARPPAPRGEG